MSISKVTGDYSDEGVQGMHFSIISLFIALNPSISVNICLAFIQMIQF